MPIEFPCEECGQTLRVPDNAAGKRARCPKCDHVGRAPAATTAPGESILPESSYTESPDPPAYGVEDVSAGGEGNPFADGPNPFRDIEDTTARWDGNPYASPTATSTPSEYYGGPEPLSDLSQRLIRNKVAGPAYALIIMGIINLLLLAAIFVSFADGGDWGPAGIVVAIMAIKGGILIAGGVQMNGRRSYGLAMTAAILAVIPCCYCWIAELPIGIWALVVLTNPYVKRAFEDEARAARYDRDRYRR